MEGKTFEEYLRDALAESKLFYKMSEVFKVFGGSSLTTRMVKNFFEKRRGRNIYTFMEKPFYPYDYFLVEVNGNDSNLNCWNLILNFPLPRYSSSIMDELVTKDLFYAFLRHVGINSESPSPCYFDGGIKYHFPIIAVDDMKDGNRKAIIINNGLKTYRKGFEKALDRIKKEYPVTNDAAEKLILKFRDDSEYGLDFLE